MSLPLLLQVRKLSQEDPRFRMASIHMMIIFASVLVVTADSNCSNGNCQVHDVCKANDDCAVGLRCETCGTSGVSNPRCIRTDATNPFSQVAGLPFNRYSWLTTHNSYAITGERSYTGSSRLTFYNQEDSVTDQLNNGVRGLMLDMYDFNNDVWLCHSFGGVCYNLTAFEPAINTLKEVEAFLAANPSAIVIIFIEDYVKAPKGLTKVLSASGLMKYWFPVARMPQNGQNWPNVDDMLSQNQRLIVFTSNPSKEASEGIAYQWRYVAENQYGDAGMTVGVCGNRAESPVLSNKTVSLFLQNYFPDDPDMAGACSNHSAPLASMLSVCYEAAAKRWANFLAVDFYKRSDGGGAFQAVDKLNGQLICGCADVTQCQANTTFGKCPQAGSIHTKARRSGSGSDSSSTAEPPAASDALRTFTAQLKASLIIFILMIVL